MKKKKTAVIIDHESWFYGMKNFDVAPNVGKVLAEIEAENDVVLRRAYGNISDVNGVSDVEREKLADFGYELVYTYEGVAKLDLTDFVVVDALYKTLYERPEIEKFIVFTGDYHYVTALRTLCEKGKEVEVWAVSGTLSSIYETFTTRIMYPEYDETLMTRVMDELVIADALGGGVTLGSCVYKMVNKFGYKPQFVRSQLNILLSRGLIVESTYLNVRGKTVMRIVKNDQKVDKVGYKTIL